jgi:hypothetical protein
MYNYFIKFDEEYLIKKQKKSFFHISFEIIFSFIKELKFNIIEKMENLFDIMRTDKKTEHENIFNLSAKVF